MMTSTTPIPDDVDDDDDYDDNDDDDGNDNSIFRNNSQS